MRCGSLSALESLLSTDPRPQNAAIKVVFHSVRQEDLDGQRHHRNDLPIIIVLAILYGALSMLLGLWQWQGVAELTLISAI